MKVQVILLYAIPNLLQLCIWEQCIPPANTAILSRNTNCTHLNGYRNVQQDDQLELKLVAVLP